MPFEVSASHLGFDVIDVATQQGVSHHYFIVGDRAALFDSPYRYVWPAELDLMARIAGLDLRDRFGDWDRAPFTAEARNTSRYGNGSASPSPRRCVRSAVFTDAG